MYSIIPLLVAFTCFYANLTAAPDPILARIIKGRLSSYPTEATPEEKAALLSREIGQIAHEAKQNGMDLQSYIKQPPAGHAPSLCSEMVWEGRTEGIPLTFFIYTWPAERVARAIAPHSTLYRSNVHKHSTSCAFTILQGSLVQENFSDVSGYTCNIARFESTDHLVEGDVEIDDLSSPSPFVHRLLCRDKQKEMSISLHAYGHPSEDQVLRSADAFAQKYAYPYELKKNRLLRL